MAASNISKSMERDTSGDAHLCIEQPEVSETTNTDNANPLAWTSAILLQWRVHCDTSAEHGSRLLRGNLIWNLENKVGGHPAVIRIAAVRLAAIGILGVICACGIGTVVFDTA